MKYLVRSVYKNFGLTVYCQDSLLIFEGNHINNLLSDIDISDLPIPPRNPYILQCSQRVRVEVLPSYPTVVSLC